MKKYLFYSLFIIIMLYSHKAIAVTFFHKGRFLTTMYDAEGQIEAIEDTIRKVYKVYKIEERHTGYFIYYTYREIQDRTEAEKILHELKKFPKETGVGPVTQLQNAQLAKLFDSFARDTHNRHSLDPHGYE